MNFELLLLLFYFFMNKVLTEIEKLNKNMA